MILFTGGGVHGRGHACPGGVCVAGGMRGRGVCVTCTPPVQILRPRHTVNERAVCILLECILVENLYPIIYLVDTNIITAQNEVGA